MVKIQIKENTLISKIAFRLIKSFKNEAVASTIGKTIHLHNISDISFSHKDGFLRHEMQHAIQFNEIKFFWLKYIIETLKNGYFKNKYEVEAENLRNAKFPRNYLAYSENVLVMRTNDFVAMVGKYEPTLEHLNFSLGLKFKKYPEIILK